VKIKRIVSILLVLIFAICTLTGCQKKTEVSDKPTSARKREGKSEKNRKSDLSGLVTVVAGNEVTIKVIQMEQDSINDGKNDKDKNKTEADKKVKKEDEEKKNNNTQKEDKSITVDSKKENQDSAEKKYNVTGETKTIIIPVGIPITIMSRGEKEEVPKDAEIKDIKKGNMLQIWYSEKDNSVISKVNIVLLDRKNTAYK
jgi:hypothetical protein